MSNSGEVKNSPKSYGWNYAVVATCQFKVLRNSGNLPLINNFVDVLRMYEKSFGPVMFLQKQKKSGINCTLQLIPDFFCAMHRNLSLIGG